MKLHQTNVKKLKKLKSKKGFTLVEMMACVLTMTMIGLICTLGLNMATRSYNESLFESGSQMLESMVDTSLGDVLRYSYDIDVAADGSKRVTELSNATFDVTHGTIKLNAEGHLVLVKNAAGSEVLLIGDNVYAEDMYLADLVITYDATNYVYTGHYTIKSKLTDQEKTINFTYKSILESI